MTKRAATPICPSCGAANRMKKLQRVGRCGCTECDYAGKRGSFFSHTRLGSTRVAYGGGTGDQAPKRRTLDDLE